MLLRIQHVTNDFIQPNDTRTRGSKRLRQLHATKDIYKYSFFPRAISDGNKPPTTVTDDQTLLRVFVFYISNKRGGGVKLEKSVDNMVSQIYPFRPVFLAPAILLGRRKPVHVPS